MAGIWVVGDCTNGKRAPQDHSRGAARRVQASKGTPSASELGALAGNVDRHEAVPGLASSASHFSIFSNEAKIARSTLWWRRAPTFRKILWQGALHTAPKNKFHQNVKRLEVRHRVSLQADQVGMSPVLTHLRSSKRERSSFHHFHRNRR